MQVIDALPRVRALVDDDAVARLTEPEILCHLPRGEHHVPERRCVFHSRVANAGDVLLRDHEHVRRRDGAKVLKGERVLVLEHDLRGDLATHDFAKEAAHDRGA